jgi:hypothetical protein
MLKSEVVAMPALFRVTALAALNVIAFVGCSSNSSSTPNSPVATGQVRAVHASPDAGPVDIYVYPGSTRPSAATVSDATYPQITGYVTVPAGTFTIDVVSHGAPSTAPAVASEHVSVAANTQYSVVVGGTVAKKSLQFINFVEPPEIAGQTALIVHHASPFVQSAINPVGVGVYDAAAANGNAPASATEVFAFSLKNPSGPATSGATPAGGEFFLSPLPSTLPAAVGFAAGPPTSPGSPLGSVVVYATPASLAAGLTNKTAAQQILASDTSSAVPAGAHLSIFAVDTVAAAQLIGTLDP